MIFFCNLSHALSFSFSFSFSLSLAISRILKKKSFFLSFFF